MELMSEANMEMFVRNFFLFEGKFPHGTTIANWRAVKLSDMQWDDPPLAYAPDFEKEKLALSFLHKLNLLGLTCGGLLPLMKMGEKSMGDLAKHCFETQAFVEVNF